MTGKNSGYFVISDFRRALPDFCWNYNNKDQVYYGSHRELLLVNSRVFSMHDSDNSDRPLWRCSIYKIWRPQHYAAYTRVINETLYSLIKEELFVTTAHFKLIIQEVM